MSITAARVSVVEAARTLLTHNRRRVKNASWPPRASAREQAELAVVTNADALSATVDRVAHLVAGEAGPGDVAVLTRVNASLAPVQVALVHRQVPVRPAVDVSYLSRGGVQAALAWLRLAVSAPEHLAGADVALAARRRRGPCPPKWSSGWASSRAWPGWSGWPCASTPGTRAQEFAGFVWDLQDASPASGGGRDRHRPAGRA